MKEQQTLKSSIYHAILEGIFSGEYRPNQILNEKELVQKYGCSKSPVREALISLCNDNILHNIPRYGYEVIRLTRSDVEEVLQYRFALESACLRLCYNTITARQLQRLSEIDELCNQTSSDLWAHWEHNKAFHLQLISCLDNSYAYAQLERSLDLLKRAYAQFYWNKWDNSLVPSDMKSHKEIIKCIKEKHIDDAVKCLELDLADFGM